jgi:hypothetical protein
VTCVRYDRGTNGTRSDLPSPAPADFQFGSQQMLKLSAVANILQTKAVSRGGARGDGGGRRQMFSDTMWDEEPSKATKTTRQFRFRKQQVGGSNPPVGSSFCI